MTPSSIRVVPDLLARGAVVAPELPALDLAGVTLRYREVEALVDRVAAGLQQDGIVAGDRVCLCLPNTIAYVIAYFAILRAGGVVVNLNPLYAERELRHLVHDSGATRAFVLDGSEAFHSLRTIAALERIVTCPLPQASPGMTSDQRITRFEGLAECSAALQAVTIAPDDVAVLQFTGGTTGLPKAAALTHASLVANCLQLDRHDTTRPERPETVMAVLPMFHVFALTSVLHFGIYSGAKIVLLPRFELQGFIDAMERTAPHRLYVVPTILIALNGVAEDRLPSMRQLRLCVSGGAPLPPEVRQRFEQRTGCQVVEGYGLTEASPTVACNPIGGPVRDGSAGVPFPDTVIEIRAVGGDALLPPGQVGEVCVRGPQLMKGYWNRPEETKEVLVGGLLHTGDIGYIDADGYLFLVDRIKDLILCGGYNVYPRVIEEALYEHPGVAETVVIGVPDPYRGEAPKAFVVAAASAAVDAETLLTFLRDRLSKIEMPREIEFRRELPKTSVGKLSRKELRDELIRSGG